MRVLVSSTFAFTICFAVWMIFAVLGIPIKQQLGLSETEFGLLAAMPVLTGSLVRVPLGIWTDRYGGRPVFFVLMLLAVVPIWLLSMPPVLALPGAGAVRRPDGRLVLGRHALCGALVSAQQAGAWPWACSAPATPARPSPSSWRRR